MNAFPSIKMAGWLPLAAIAMLDTGTAFAQDRVRLPPIYHIWSKRGVDIDIAMTNEWYSLVKGGIKEGSDTLSNIDLVMTIDTAESLMWQNGHFLFYVLGTNGGDPTGRTGDLQYASNIEANDTVKLYEAWYEHDLPDWQSAVLFGMHDVNREFYVLDFAGLFTNSSFGIGPDLSQVSPSTFPATTLGLRYSFRPSSGHYLNVAVYDGIAGDPDNGEGTHLQFNHGDGVLAIAEGGMLFDGERYAKLGVGVWHHTASFEDFSGGSRDDNMGTYAIAESQLWRSTGGVQLAGFAQLGFAKADRNQVARYTGIGINLTGLLPGRPRDVAGIGIAHAENGDAIRALDNTLVRAETAIEVTYVFRPLPWITVQPDVQYIVDPGTSAGLHDAVVASMRVELVF